MTDNIYHIEEALKKASLLQKEPPLSLRRNITEEVVFPIDALPKVMRAAVLSLQDIFQAPLPLCAHSIMSVANLAVQGHANVNLPLVYTLPIGRIRPISCFFLTIAESGERKTSCDNEALKSIDTYEEVLRKEYDFQLQAWKSKCSIWDLQYKEISKKKTAREQEKALEALGERPLAPLKYLTTVTEPTLEGLCKLFLIGQPSIGLFSSEGGQFLNGYSMKEENKIRTAATLCDLWDGTTIKRIRSSEDSEPIEGKRLAIHLMLQPQIAKKFLSDSQLLNQGLLSRVLITFPKSTIGTRLRSHIDPASYVLLQNFHNTIKGILSTPKNLAEGSRNILKPRAIELTTEARVQYFNFIQEVERELIEEGMYESIKAFGSKLGEHALRLAATFSLVENIYTNTIERHHIESGINVAKYYAQEAVRLLNINNEVSPDLLLAEKLIKWIYKNWKEEYISLPDIYQKTLNEIDTRGKALKVIKILEGHKWLEKVKGKMLVCGQVRQDVWRIVKCV